jgi:hypothetical protein
LAGLGARFDLRADVAGMKRLHGAGGSTHRGPSMARCHHPKAFRHLEGFHSIAARPAPGDHHIVKD